MLRCHEGKCRLCRCHECRCECEELRKHKVEDYGPPMDDGERAEHHELCSNGDWFKVVDFKYSGPGRDGVVYTIVKCKTMATAKSKENADEIARRLNLARKTDRDNARLRSELRTAMQLAHRTHYGPTVEGIKSAMVKELELAGYCRWSSGRHRMGKLMNSVLRRLGYQGSDIS